MAGNGAPTVVLIPGIGGHPRFHDGLAAALGERCRVHTAPHVDFFAEPCPDWNGHVEHWLSRFQDAAAEPGGRPPALVGVSFGAHVAWELWRRLPAGAADALVLVSYWPLDGCQRRALRALRRLPRIGSAAVGTACFRWSQHQAKDADRLRLLRRELYDDERLARRRLWARLVSLADAPPPPVAPARQVTTPAAGMAARPPAFVYASRELPLRAMRHRLGGRLPEGTVVVDGNHSISVNDSQHGSAALASAVARLIGQPAIRGDE